MAGPPSTPPARRSRRGSGAVTLHDVAKLAGVAPITASRALNTPSQVSEEVRQRVADAIARTGYVPNRLAGGLASTRSRLVAAVVPTISGPVFLGTVQSLTEALAEPGLPADARPIGLQRFARGRAAGSHHRPPARRHRAHRHHAFGPRAPAAAGCGHPGGRDLGPHAHAHRHAGGLLARRSGPRGGRLPARQGPAPPGHRGAGDDERARRRRCSAFQARAAELGWPKCRSEVRARAHHAAERAQTPWPNCCSGSPTSTPCSAARTCWRWAC
jgi:LacI family gluconate utilization system Gnt-I transcriptional repressor